MDKNTNPDLAISGKEEGILEAITLRSPYPYWDIERAYRRLRSFDLLLTCISLAARLNISLDICSVHLQESTEDR